MFCVFSFAVSVDDVYNSTQQNENKHAFYLKVQLIFVRCVVVSF